MIELAYDDWRLGLQPGLGGSVAYLRHGRLDVLRPTAEGETAILQTACFPLVPYANRVAAGRFVFGGHEVILPHHDPAAANALHGDGWLSAWTVDGVDEVSATLTLDHDGDGAWPWAWRAVQRLSLSDDGLRIELDFTNRAAESMPAGLGLHPYFPRSAQARLTAPAPEAWLVDEALIPTRLAPASAVFDWSKGPLLSEAPPVDHCYVGWSGEAVLDQGRGGGAMVIGASKNAHWLQVYAPPEGSFCCVEPVTHMPDAVNRGAGADTGLAILAPGETLSMWMTIGLR